jgi:hypothetical protein
LVALVFHPNLDHESWHVAFEVDLINIAAESS